MISANNLHRTASEFLQYVKNVYIEDRDEAQHVNELAYTLEKALQQFHEENCGNQP